MRNPKTHTHDHTWFACRILGSLVRSREPYLERDYLQKHAIECRPMDFYTGVLFHP